MYESLHSQLQKIDKYLIPGVDFITPWSSGFLEKLTVSQLIKKFPIFYGTQRFITAFTRACHLSLF
jgi:hypothetical protein